MPRHLCCRLKTLQTLEATHVNLVDFMYRAGPDEFVRKFPTEVDLSEYTCSHELYFPRRGIRLGSLLTYLLRHILNPSATRGQRKDSKKGKETEGVSKPRRESPCPVQTPHKSTVD